MVDSPDLEESPAGSAHEGLRAHACVLCQRRKVKCDKNDPCSNCAKSQVECEFRDPLPPRRRKKKQPDAAMIARLKRYENVLRNSGIDPSSLDANGRMGAEPNRYPASENRLSSPRASKAASEPDIQKPRLGRLIRKEGRSLYLDNNLWKTVSNELQDADDILPESSDDTSPSLHGQVDVPDLDESSFLFGASSRHKLTLLHPSPIHIFKLWQFFLDGFNPLTKSIHVPTVQQRILDATSDLASVSRELEALMFAIYCAALMTLTDEEAVKSFGETKTKLLDRYRNCARQALMNAGVLKTSELVVLQAFLIFLLSVRLAYDPYTLWSLCGVAVRLAQRLGLHRDGSQLGLSVFETEMRRRVWWEITVIDATVGHMSGCVSSLLPVADTKTPLNLNDSALDPEMKEIPVESSGPTEMIFVLMRYELGKWLARQAKSSTVTFDGLWDTINTSATALEEKDRLIDELEHTLEDKYVRHCDSSIPLHLVTLIVARSMVAISRLRAHHPRNWHEKGEEMPQSERDRLFDVCMSMGEYSNILLATDKMKRFFWHIDFHFPWDTVIYMLSEPRLRTMGDQTAKAWQLIDVICRRPYQNLGQLVKSPLHLAIANLAMKAWMAHIAECERRQVRPLPQPETITLFWKLIQRSKSAMSQQLGATPTEQSFASGTLPPNTDHRLHQSSPNFSDPILNPVDPDFDMSVMEGMYSLDDSPMDWAQWDDLLQRFQHQNGEMEAFPPPS